MVVKSFWVFTFLFVGIILLGSVGAQAQITTGLVRDPRGMSMGGTGVGLADDVYALFNNPAGLAGQNDRRFRIVGLSLEASQDTYTELSTSLSTLHNFQLSDLNKLMGKNIYLRMDYVPIFQLPHFAVTYLFDVQGALNEQNTANPTFNLTDMLTHGVQAGMGWDLLQSGKKSAEELRVGVAGKLLWRRGGQFDVSTSGFLEASTQGANYVNSLVGNFGMGIGADAGVQYINRVDQDTKLFFGSSMTDIGNTSFTGGTASPIPMNLGLGIGAERRLAVGHLKLALDLRNLTQTTAFVNMTHFGAELSLPLFDLDVGLNQFNVTAGVAFDVWVLRVMVSTYAEEYGLAFHQDTSRQYLLSADFNLPI